MPRAGFEPSFLVFEGVEDRAATGADKVIVR